MHNAVWTARLPESLAEAPTLFPINALARTRARDATEGAILDSGKQQRPLYLWLFIRGAKRREGSTSSGFHHVSKNADTAHGIESKHQTRSPGGRCPSHRAAHLRHPPPHRCGHVLGAGNSDPPWPLSPEVSPPEGGSQVPSSLSSKSGETTKATLRLLPQAQGDPFCQHSSGE